MFLPLTSSSEIMLENFNQKKKKKKKKKMLPLWLGTPAIVSQLLTCPWSYRALQEMNLPDLALTAGISGHFILGHLFSFPCSAPGDVCLLTAHSVTRWLLMSNYNLPSPPCTCAPRGSSSLTHL